MNKTKDILSTLYKKYEYILSKETIDSIFKEVAIRNDINSIDFIEEINKYINYYINLITTDKENFIKIILNYIDKNFINETVDDFNKFVVFLKKFNHLYSPDFCIEIIQKSNKLNNTLKNIVNENIQIIKKDNIQSINSSNIFITFIECYCDINNIVVGSDIDQELFEKLDIDSTQLDALKIYFNDIKRPLLTREEEIELIKRKNNGDEEARRILIESNLRYVVKYAFKYISNPQLDIKDVIQDGNIGLIIGVDKLDNKGCKVLTYVHFWIRAIINRGIATKSRLIRLPDGTYNLHKKYQYSKEKLSCILNRVPTNKEIAADIGVNESTVEALSKIPEDAYSLNELKYSEFGNEEIIDSVQDENVESTEMQAINNIMVNEVHDCLYNSELNDREIKILELRYGLNGNEPLTLESIAKILNISRQRVNVLEINALNKLRKNKYRKRLVDFTDTPDHSNKKAVDTYVKVMNKRL